MWCVIAPPPSLDCSFKQSSRGCLPFDSHKRLMPRSTDAWTQKWTSRHHESGEEWMCGRMKWCVEAQVGWWVDKLMLHEEMVLDLTLTQLLIPTWCSWICRSLFSSSWSWKTKCKSSKCFCSRTQYSSNFLFSCFSKSTLSSIWYFSIRSWYCRLLEGSTLCIVSPCHPSLATPASIPHQTHWSPGFWWRQRQES